MAEVNYLNNNRDRERRGAIIHFASEILDLDKYQGRKNIPSLSHRLTTAERRGIKRDLYGALDASNPKWKRINGSNRFSFTYAGYMAYQAKRKLKSKLADLENYGRSNYGIDRLNVYLLTVNPAKLSSSYGKLKTAHEAILLTLRSIIQVATIQANIENAVVYRDNKVGVGNDRHLHYVIASTASISRRTRRDAVSKIKGDCRSIYGYGQTSVDFSAGNVSKTAGYGTKGVALFDPLKIDRTVGQDQYEKILTAERNVNRRAGMIILADEMNASRNVNRSYFYINRRNAVARSWQKSIESLKKYRRNIEHPGNEPEDCSMDLFTIGKSRKRRRRVQSSHHATTVEAVRTFNGLNRYTGKELRRTREAIEARSRKILRWSRRIMADLTNEGKKSLKSLELPGLDQAKTSPEAIAEAVTANTS